MENADERARYLKKACPEDAALAAEIEGLVAARKEADAFFEFVPPGLTVADPQAGVGAVADVDVALVEQAGTVIGNYKLLQKIGEGGFGVVYMAEQIKPVCRRVALKIIKLGMDTREVVARFEAERQALALMDDFNIAKVFDAGSTESGRPYFVMELVRGIPITEFADKHSLSTADRIHLFLDVCSAIQHAHQKGIIHRDIKPSNILVSLHGDRAVPKVIDFGIAKAMQQRLTEKTLFTRFGQFIGTPAYMSPEQALTSGQEIDTRSDVYSLGVLLYELLTGVTPLDSQSLREVGYQEISRLICEEEPPKPSTRVSTMQEEEQRSIAKCRGLQPNRLSSLFRGDLDWVIMRAIEKDQTRRYSSAEGLADDLRRHLNCEPVLAHAPSFFYRWHKFARKHRVMLSIATLFLVTLMAATTISSIQALRATRAADRERVARADETEARQQAEWHSQLAASKEAEAQNQREVAESERERAQRMSATADRQVAEVLLDQGRVNEALMHLSRSLQTESENEATFRFLTSVMARRPIAYPVGLPIRLEQPSGHGNISDDGSTYVGARRDGRLVMIDLKTGESLTSRKEVEIEGSQRQSWLSLLSPPRAIRVMANGNLAAVLERRHVFSFWSTQSAENLGSSRNLEDEFASSDEIVRWRVAPDNRAVHALSRGHEFLSFAVPSGELVSQVALPGDWSRLSDEGRFLFTASIEPEQTQIDIREIRDGQLGLARRQTIPLPARFFENWGRFVFHTDAADPSWMRMAVMSRPDHSGFDPVEVVVWDFHRQAIIYRGNANGAPFYSMPKKIFFNPDGTEVLMGRTMVNSEKDTPTILIHSIHMEAVRTRVNPDLDMGWDYNYPIYADDGHSLIFSSDSTNRIAIYRDEGGVLRLPWVHRYGKGGRGSLRHVLKPLPGSREIVYEFSSLDHGIERLHFGGLAPQFDESLAFEGWNAMSADAGWRASLWVGKGLKGKEAYRIYSHEQEAFEPSLYEADAGSVVNLEFSPDGEWLVGNGGPRGSLRSYENLFVWKRGQSRPVAQLRASDLGSSEDRIYYRRSISSGADWIAFETSRERERPAVGYDYLGVYLWNPHSNENPERLEVDGNALQGEFEVSPDGTLLFCLGRDGVNRLFEYDGAWQVAATRLPSDLVSAAFSHDSRTLVWLERAGTLGILDLQTQAIVRQRLWTGTFTPNPGWQPQFSADDRWLLLRATRGHFLWDWRRGQPASDLITEPIRVSDRPVLSPDGCRLMVARRQMKIMDLAPAQAGVPSWFHEFVAGYAGMEFDDRGGVVPMDRFKRSETLRSIRAREERGEAVRWAKWLITAPKERPVTPSGRQTLSEHIDGQIEYRGLGRYSIQPQALTELDPWHPGALSLEASMGLLPGFQLSADRIKYLVRRALSIDDRAEGAWFAKALLEWSHDQTDVAAASLFEAEQRGVSSFRIDFLRGLVAEERNDFEGAMQAFTRARNRVDQGGNEWANVWQKTLVTRQAMAAARMQRWEELRSIQAQDFGIPERTRETPVECLNLDHFYNSGIYNAPGSSPRPSSSSLPALGVKETGTTAFDLRGFVLFGNPEGPRSEIAKPTKFPTTVSEIPVQSVARRIHVLHALVGDSRLPGNRVHLKIADITYRYTDGSLDRQSLMLGRDAAAFIGNGPTPSSGFDRPPDPENRVFEFPFENPVNPTQVLSGRFFHSIWENPHPEKMIESIDLECVSSDACLGVAAITLEP